MGDLSPHFSTREFACHHCGVAVIAPHLVERLERLRKLAGSPLWIVSGYRCAVHNRRIGGALKSQHLLGNAADLHAGVATVAEARSAGFIGVGRVGNWAVHVDLRPGIVTVFNDP